MILALALLASGLNSNGKPAVKSAQSDEAAINQLISKMSLDDKLKLLGGVDGFFTRSVKDIGLTRFRTSDGPVGLRNQGPSTAYPAGVMLAATWDRSMASAFGNAIGIDARARGVNYWLGPGIDLDRIPQNGRNFEYLGENPFLTGAMVVPLIEGVQSHQVACTVKHYACNDNEVDRQTDDSIVDERTLHEVQLYPFEQAVKKAHVWAIMDSYNLINGEHASQNWTLLTKILKDQWGFQGVVMSDWGATHDGSAAFKAGQDLEMPSADYMSPDNLKPLLESGKLSMSLLDDKVRRQLRVAYALDWLKRPQTSGEPWVQVKNDAVALKIATEGITLLANPNQMLPLKGNGSYVVIGPNAVKAVTGGGGSSFVDPHKSIALLAALHQTSPKTGFLSIPYTGADMFRVAGIVTHDGKPGWQMSVFTNKNLDGTPAYEAVSGSINYNWSTTPPATNIPHDNYSVRWTGKYTPYASGRYTLSARSDDGMRVFVGNKEVVNMWQDQGATTKQAELDLTMGQTYDIRIEYYQSAGEAIADFGLVPMDTPVFNSAEEQVISRADAVIAAIGFNPNIEAEGVDRTWTLPPDQVAMIKQAMQLNKKVILVLNAGGAVDLAEPVKNGAAVVDSYYPGENGDLAVAQVLFGKLNPSGKLPCTFPSDIWDLFSTGSYPSANGQIQYQEGVFIGQRGLDIWGKDALFPFGYGLSYSHFSDLTGKVQQKGSGASSILEVSGSLRNVSPRSGSDTIQAYIEFPKSPVKRPLGQLEGFQRVEVPAHGMSRFSISIPLSSLGYWDVNLHNWKVVPGQYHVVLADQGFMPYGQKIGHGLRWSSSFEVSKSLAQAINRSEKP